MWKYNYFFTNVQLPWQLFPCHVIPQVTQFNNAMILLKTGFLNSADSKSGYYSFEEKCKSHLSRIWYFVNEQKFILTLINNVII